MGGGTGRPEEDDPPGREQTVQHAPQVEKELQEENNLRACGSPPPLIDDYSPWSYHMT